MPPAGDGGIFIVPMPGNACRWPRLPMRGCIYKKKQIQFAVISAKALREGSVYDQ
jgi:hypothetical protein